MTFDPVILERLLQEKQSFFTPFYRAIVDQHPAGISATQVKAMVAQQILQEFGIDIFDSSLVGVNPSTNRSTADQWANNLISNYVLDDFMLVVRSGRAMLYPGLYDNSRTISPSGKPIKQAGVIELDKRSPKQLTTNPSRSFLRSIQLAEYVRGLGARRCVIAGPRCSNFNARDGRPYVEVHHIIPMAMQTLTDVNLDRTKNMVPLCPGCHTCLHRGSSEYASRVLEYTMKWIESVHGVTFQTANSDVDLDLTPSGLLQMYAETL